MVTPPPGDRARELSRALAHLEASGINTLPESGETLLWREALGANVLDVDGNRYLDLTAGFGAAAVGHRHPAVVEAIHRQSADLVHGLADVHAHPLRVELARRLCRLVPIRDPRIYFTISGADAVEVALKTAVLATGRPGVLAFEPSYHGLTLGALAATSRPAFRDPFAEHLHHHLHRLPFGCPLGEIEGLLDGEPTVGCAIVEPIVGREGVLLPPAGWLSELAHACRVRGALLIADEIFTGFGRTGALFAVDHDGLRPDLLCCGKALGGGLPIAATLGAKEVMDAWKAPGEARHTATFVAHPLGCAAALAALDVVSKEGLVARAESLGSELAGRLSPWAERFAAVRQTRGRGLLWGIELTSAGAAKSFADRALQRGVILLAGGPAGRVAQIVPPLTITRAQLESAIGILESTLEQIDPDL